MLRKVFDSMSTGVVILNREAKVKFFNKYMDNFLKERELSREDAENMGEIFGNLFSCIHTEEEGKKCGETENCPDCPLRSSLPGVSEAKQIVVFEKEFYDPENGGKNYYGISMKPMDEEGEDVLIELFQIKNSNVDILSIHHENLEEKVGEYREKFYRDMLTGMYNRNFFEEKILDIYTGLETTGISVIDLDGLKGINDRSGHMVGDETIKETAQIIRDTVGEKGYSIRMGGDEFIIIFDADSETAVALNHKILEEGKRNGRLFSIGYSARRYREEKIEELLRRADEAMYTAKRNGKGKFVIGY